MSEQAGVFPPAIHEDPIRRALDCLREGFQIIGRDWTYVYLNPAAARHGRREARELIGRHMVEAYPGIDRTPLFDILKRAMEERTSHVFENEFTFPDGDRRWFEIRVQPVPEGICVYSSDIEHRKRRAPHGHDVVVHTSGREPWLQRIARLLRGTPEHGGSTGRQLDGTPR